MSKCIAIIGTRSRDTEDDFNRVYDAFSKIWEPGDTLVSGGCPKGGDRFAELIAGQKGIPITIHYPDTTEMPKNAPRWMWAQVYYERNTLVAQDADCVIACVEDKAKYKKGGTGDTIKKFMKFKQSNPGNRLILV